jgi:DNA polymerase-3 subunit delta'
MSITPVNNPILIGHDEAMRQVAEAFASSRMHHAWLLTGIEGIGKTTLAYHIAQHVLSSGQNALGKIDMNHRVAKLIAAEAHPDMLVVRRATDDKTGELRNVIVVDDALKIASFLHKTSTHGGWRVVIIDEAHALNRHGQNAILKILEEPPARVLILITATTPGALLPTIRSRCRVLQLAPLDDAHMKTILARSGPELASSDIDRLIRLSGGSIGFALKILRTETLPLYEELLSLLRDLPKLDTTRLHKLADQISRKADAESFDVIRALLIDHLREIAREQASSGSDGRVINLRIQLWDKVRATFAMADTGNLDRKLAFINAVGEIRNAA